MFRTAQLCVAALMVLLSASTVLAGETLQAGEAKKLAGDFTFTEGPAADAEGNVYFSDIPSNRILKWSTAGELSTFFENSGGANGLYFDKEGNLIACQGGARRMVSISPDKKIEALADAYDGKKFNSPNDLWIDADGGVYFSDPRYGSEQGLEQDGFHVYYLSPDRKSLTQIIDDLMKPNGVLGTADGKSLYVADAGGGKTYVYAIEGPGKLGERKLFAEQGSDGLTRDERGNVYLTSREGLNVYGPDGKLVEKIAVPESPSNVTFGGKEKKTLFITARTSVYSCPMEIPGHQFPAGKQ